MRRIVLDTDMGTDADDALCLALALAAPEVELVAVTTVSADTTRRARIARRLLDLAGRPDVPVHAGEGTPRRRRQRLPLARRRGRLPARPRRRRRAVATEPAVDALARLLRARRRPRDRRRRPADQPRPAARARAGARHAHRAPDRDGRPPAPRRLRRSRLRARRRLQPLLRRRRVAARAVVRHPDPPRHRRRHARDLDRPRRPRAHRGTPARRSTRPWRARCAPGRRTCARIFAGDGCPDRRRQRRLPARPAGARRRRTTSPSAASRTSRSSPRSWAASSARSSTRARPAATRTMRCATAVDAARFRAHAVDRIVNLRREKPDEAVHVLARPEPAPRARLPRREGHRADARVGGHHHRREPHPGVPEEEPAGRPARARARRRQPPHRVARDHRVPRGAAPGAADDRHHAARARARPRARAHLRARRARADAVDLPEHVADVRGPRQAIGRGGRDGAHAAGGEPHGARRQDRRQAVRRRATSRRSPTARCSRRSSSPSSPAARSTAASATSRAGTTPSASGRAPRD